VIVNFDLTGHWLFLDMTMLLPSEIGKTMHLAPAMSNIQAKNLKLLIASQFNVAPQVIASFSG
jgi:hypothetical protein